MDGSRAVRRRGWGRRVVYGVAWLGLLASLNQVTYVVYDALMNDRSGAITRAFYIEGRFEAVLQTYRGEAGALLAGGQLALVLLGMGLVIQRGGAARRVGVVLLVGWMLLWLGNAVAAVVLAPGLQIAWIHFAFVAPPALCALIYAADRWGGSR